MDIQPTESVNENKTSQEVFRSQPSSLSDRTKEDSAKAPMLSDYLDYRLYLKDFYEYQRATQKGLRPYSYSVFSAAANIKSPNYLKLIIDGKRNLSADMTKKFAKALRLNRVEAEEFRYMVLYGQEADPLRRNQILRDLAEIRVDQKIRSGEISRENWERVPSWVGWVLYAMTDQEGVDFNIEKLTGLLKGKANADEVRNALEKLLESGQLKRNETNQQLIEKGESVSGADEVPVALVRKLQAELNYLGMESLFEDTAKEREFGALTVALTEEEFEQYKFELRQLRKRIHKEVAVKRQEGAAERVYQINLQLFPITDSVRKK